VTIKLDFSKPFVAHNIAEFTLEPAGEATTVTWAMSGQTPFHNEGNGPLHGMDKIVGKDFEAGLASLKGRDRVTWVGCRRITMGSDFSKTRLARLAPA